MATFRFNLTAGRPADDQSRPQTNDHRKEVTTVAWLQVHQTLKDHRKLFDAADQLEVEPPHMMGLLVSFWLWALDNAPTGSLVDITPRMISRAAQWDGDPEKLAKTLIRAGWIDEKRTGRSRSTTGTSTPAS